MKKSIKLGVVAAALMAVAGLVFAQAGTDIKPDPIVPSSSSTRRKARMSSIPRGVDRPDPFGLCWRTGSWSVERAAAAKIEGAPFPNWTAGCECDRDLMKAPTCEPPPPPPAAASTAGSAAPAAPCCAGSDEREGDVRG